VAKLKQAVSKHGVLALLRSGGPPGIMYVEGSEKGVIGWVDAVQVGLVQLVPITTETYGTLQNLRYKDYQLAIKPAPVKRDTTAQIKEVEHNGLREFDTVKAFSLAMTDRGVYEWWRQGMGYTGNRL